jgi:hypothetical protein
MKVKNYSKFLENQSQEFSIYDFYNYCGDVAWHNVKLDEGELKSHIEHFIGTGTWDIINSHFTKIFNVLQSVNMDFIDARMYDIFDEYLNHDVKYAVRCVAYGDFDRWDAEPERRYNGMMSVRTPDNQSKLSNISSFIRTLLYPCLFLSDFKSKSLSLRTTPDEIYVNSDEFSIKNLPNTKLQIEDNFEKTWSFSKYLQFAKDFSLERCLSVSKYLQFAKDFSLERCLSVYKPGIFINISSDKYMGSKMSYNKIIGEFEELLPAITGDLDVEVICMDKKRPQDMEIYDFDVKIILSI